MNPRIRCANGAARLAALATAVLAVLAAGCGAAMRGSDAPVTSAAPLPSTSMTSPAPVADPARPAVTVTVPPLPVPEASDSQDPAAVQESEQPEGVVINPEELQQDCAACREVLATGQAGPFAAALVTMTKQRAGLVAVDSAGAIGKPLVVGHGGIVREPDGGVLPCDAAGRCVVIADRKKGAIASAYAVGEGGEWQDISGRSAFPSASAKAGVIDVDGELGIAVQESGAGQTGWIVLTWSGARYTVHGCAPDSDVVPTAAELSLEACLS